MVLKDDKGAETISMDKSDYIKNMNEHLDSSGNYKRLENNPISKIITEVKKIIKESNLDEWIKK